MSKLSAKDLSTIGTLATVAGIGISLFSGWVKNQQLDNLVEQKVADEVARQTAETIKIEEV